MDILAPIIIDMKDPSTLSGLFNVIMRLLNSYTVYFAYPNNLSALVSISYGIVDKAPIMVAAIGLLILIKSLPISFYAYSSH